MKRYLSLEFCWAEPDNKNGQNGFKVIQQDGNTTWMDKFYFELRFKRCDALPFGTALECLKHGFRVHRLAWGLSKYLDLRKKTDGDLFFQMTENNRFKSWAPTQEDLMAEDWVLTE